MKGYLFVILALVLPLGCKRTEDKKPDESAKPDASHADENEHEGLPKRVRLTADVIAAAGIKSQKVAKTVLPSAKKPP